MDETGKLRKKKASQKGKKEGGDTGREEDTQWEKQRGRNRLPAREANQGQHRETEGAEPHAVSPEPGKPGLPCCKPHY